MSTARYPYPKDVRRILGIVFGCLGLVMVTAGVTGVVVQLTSINSSARATGTVIELRESRGDDGYAPVVEFVTPTEESIVITSSVYGSPSAYDIGEKVEVAYDPANPRDASIIGFGLWLWQLILGGIGAVFAILGTIFFAIVVRRRRAIDRLIEFGHAVPGTVLDVVNDYTQRINNRHPFRVIVGLQNPADGTPMQVRSDPVWQDPRYLLPSTVTVWVDPKDPGTHLVDLSFLPR